MAEIETHPVVRFNTFTQWYSHKMKSKLTVKRNAKKLGFRILNMQHTYKILRDKWTNLKWISQREIVGLIFNAHESRVLS